MIDKRLCRCLLLSAATSVATAQEISLGSFTTRQHDVAGEIVALSHRVLEIRGFVYDGTAPAAFLWADADSSPSPGGFILQDGSPSSSCGAEELPRVTSETYRVEFPEGTSLLDILGGSISVWCEAFDINFGELVIPTTVEGLASTEEGPALECSAATEPEETAPPIAVTPEGYNCEPLNEDYQVRWQVQGDTVAIELVGLIDDSVYMGFGVSGSDDRTNMVGADAVVADVFEGEFRARDFYMNSRAQCSNGDGVCPDNGVRFNNDVSSVSGEQESGITLVRYTRPLIPTNVEDSQGGQAVDHSISVEPGVSTFVVWALGPVDESTGLPFFHSIAFPAEDVNIEFGRNVQDNCEPLVEGEEIEDLEPFQRPVLTDVTTFSMHIGPSGGARGYMSITGRAAWGIAWYINDLLIPIIEMRRNTTYTFLINGGDNPDSASEFHPLYLTTSIDGGYAQRTPQDRLNESVLGGINITNQTDEGVFGFDEDTLAAGPPCVYGTSDDTEEAMLGSYGEFFASLDTSCAQNTTITDAAAVLTFTPNENTPDLLYYQCVTHRNLGWKIRIINEDAPSIQQVDCSNFGDDPISLRDGLTLNAVINPVDNTLTAELIYDGIGWLAMGFTPGFARMIGSEAVIGLPGEPNSDTNPGKYSLNAQNVAGVQLMPDNQQTLINSTIEQTDTQTILRFTKLLVEEGEHPISATEGNTFLYAFGSDNNLDVHQGRGGFTLPARQCEVFVDGVLQNANLTAVGVVTPPPTQPPGDNVVDLGNGVTLSADFNEAEGTMTAELVYNGLGWLAMAFTAGEAQMVGSEAVIGLPGDPNGDTNPGKYNLNAQNVAGVQLMPDSQQTLIDASVEQTDTQTILRFTKLLVEEGEHPISATEENTFLYAYGSDNNLAVHAVRAGFALQGNNVDVEDGGLNRDLWVAHGACAATAWAILVPLAVGSSLIRRVLQRIGLSPGAWFQLHRILNTIAAALTIAAFSLAVRGINERPGDQDHFSQLTHHKVGLAIFILTFFQALGGILRPHLPHPPKDGEDTKAKKSKMRKIWEVGHRLVGASLIGMAWWQVQDGFTLFAANIGGEDITNTFWGIVGGICGCLAVLFVYQKFRLKD